MMSPSPCMEDAPVISLPCCKVRDPGHLTCDNEASVRGRTDKHPDKSKPDLGIQLECVLLKVFHVLL